MAHVLIATDLSAHALNAAVYAVKLYGIEGNSFTLLNTFQTPPSGPDLLSSPGDLAPQLSAEGLEEFAARLHEALPDGTPDLSTVTAYGALETVLRDMATDEQRPDVVVMGTHGITGMERVLMGSTTAAVIKGGHLPVLAVPREARYTDPKRIVLADDGGPVDRQALKVMVDIARWSRSEVMIVHVVPEGRSTEDELGDIGYDIHLGAIPHTYHSVSGDDVMVAVNDLADQSDADLMVVVHRQRGLIEQLFHHSVATELALHTRIPLLVLQQGNG
ncbi:MAG: universal stress protein [Flavobacteriales bacterium]|nr:universal stress protein [Flavobacteriales bacterium]